MNKSLVFYFIFLSLQLHAQGLIHEFNFNGTLNNTTNTLSLIGTENYVADRMGVANSAQRLHNKSLKAIIENIPQSNNPRTISIWVKLNDIASANYIWGYGTAYNAQYFGLLQQGSNSSNSNLSLAGWGAANDIIVNTSLENNTWYNYSITFDGKVSKIFVNGNLIKSAQNISRNTKGTIFKLGEINNTLGIKADVDDLKIYNIALSDKEILNLYNSSKPVVKTSSVDVEKIGEHKKEIVRGSAESKTMKNPSAINGNNKVAKKIEIFSQGQKVTNNSSKEINLNDLPEGTYLLKITPTNKPVKKKDK